MQVAPDWQKMLRGAAAERLLVNFQFRGPGWYLTKSDCLLLVPNVPPEEVSFEKEWPEDTIYFIYCWNVPLQETIFSVQNIPTRLDNRS